MAFVGFVEDDGIGTAKIERTSSLLVIDSGGVKVIVSSIRVFFTDLFMSFSLSR